MIRIAATAALALMLAAPPAAASEQLKRLVESDLKKYGFEEVDVDSLTTSQLAAIHSVANEKRRGGRRGQIRSILGGSYTVRGLFQ
jgi:hypothetical protein